MVWVVLAMSKSNEPWTKLVEKSTAEKRCSSKDSISCLFSNNDWLWQTKWFIECELRLESRTCLSKPWELVKPQLHVAKMPTPPDTSLGRATRDEDEHNEAFALSEITWRNSCGVVESQLSDAWVVYQMLVAYGFSWTGFSFWWSLLSDFREDLPAPVRHEPLHHQRILRYVCTMLLLRVIGSPREGQPRFFGPKLMQPWEKEIDMESIQDSKKSKGSLMYPPAGTDRTVASPSAKIWDLNELWVDVRMSYRLKGRTGRTRNFLQISSENYESLDSCVTN